MELPASLSRSISPPRSSKRRKTSEARDPQIQANHYYAVETDPTSAAVEAGKVKIEDHLTYFNHHLARASRSTLPDVPRLPMSDFIGLYRSNQHQHGHHFVIHQHNHPRAGVHYDLRLQFSATSSASWAFPKGLPGDPNSRQLGRMAIETRVHNLWNNLIESASMKTGSLLIWDTGTYSVLPNKKDTKEMPSPKTSDEDESGQVEGDGQMHRDNREENEKLITAFRSRHIRLRLHGTRLPKDSTVTLRLPSNNDVTKKPAVRRRRSKPLTRERRHSRSSDSDSTSATSVSSRRAPPVDSATADAEQVDISSLDTDSEEDARTRSQNAYPGSTNSIGSIHQRRWFVLLDRQSSGFESTNGKWTRRVMSNGELGGFDRFVVRGRDHERSVVTGRLARDVENDEGCEGYIGRGGWKSIDH